MSNVLDFLCFFEFLLYVEFQKGGTVLPVVSTAKFTFCNRFQEQLIGKAHVVHEDEYNIGALLRERCRQGDKKRNSKY